MKETNLCITMIVIYIICFLSVYGRAEESRWELTKRGRIKIMKQKWLVITIFIFCLCFINQDLYAKTIPLPWVYSTVYIENLSTGKTGTGFLVIRQIDKD